MAKPNSKDADISSESQITKYGLLLLVSRGTYMGRQVFRRKVHVVLKYTCDVHGLIRDVLPPILSMTEVL